MQDCHLFPLMFHTRACLTNVAVLTVGINIALLVATADILRLTTINRDRTRLLVRHSFIKY